MYEAYRWTHDGHRIIPEALTNDTRSGSDRKAFFTFSDQSRYTLWPCQNVCDALSYLLDNIYNRFGTKLYRQIVGIPMGTICAPLVADLFILLRKRFHGFS